ncbi:MAG: hypothetical protein ACHP7M_07535 [Burkholderiales bacterium]
MKSRAALVALIAAAGAVTVARGGHEFPIYPSYYPHQISIETMPPDRAADLLRDSKIQAYVGAEPRFAGSPPDSAQAIESLGSFVVVRVNAGSPLAKDNAQACAIGQDVMRDVAANGTSVTFHPYPITPFQGDYLYHVDQADAAKAQFSEHPASPSSPALRALKVRANSMLTKRLVRPQWYTEGPNWDAAIEEVSAADLVAAAGRPTNGRVGPPWLRSGWFHAALLLEDSADDAATRERVQGDVRRLESGVYDSAVERINLERELVAGLAASCHAMVAGYTVKREYISVEYSAGIENIGFDALEGLNSPIFLRTVKLKDFPWNGILSLGIDAPPVAAWNPVAGFTDKFGRLMWAAVGDPALIASPNDAGWMFNRISDVRATPAR